MSVYNVSATKNLNAAKRRRQEELIETYEGLGGGNPAYKPIQNNVLARRQNLPSIPALEKSVVEQYESAPRATGKGLRTGNESNLATHNRLSDIPTIANTNHRNAQQQYANVYNDILNRQIGQTLEELGQTDVARGNNSAYVEDLKRTGGSLNPFDYDNLGDYLMNSPYSAQAALSNYASDVLSGAKDRTEGKAWYQTSPVDYALSQLADRTGVEGTRGNLTPEMIAAGLTEKDLELWNNAQNESERRSLLSEWADKHGFGATVNAVPENFFGSVGNVGRDLKNWITGKPIEDRPNNGEIYRETVSNNIDVSDKEVPEWLQNVPVLGRPLKDTTYNDLARLGYSGLNSVADMAFATMLGAPFGAAGGALAKLAPKVGAGVMGVEKASQTMNDAVSRGLNPDQIIAEGGLSGLATYITERLPFEKFANGGSIWGGMLSEGLQEGAEDLADSFFDNLVTNLGGNSEKSSFNTSVQQYIDAGYTPEGAKEAAKSDYINQLITDSVLGGLTGGLMQGGTNLVQGRNVVSGKIPKVESEVITNLKQVSEDLKANPSAEKFTQFTELVDTLANQNPEIREEIGNIYNDVESFYDKNEADIPDSINENIESLNKPVDNVNENVDTPVANTEENFANTEINSENVKAEPEVRVPRREISNVRRTAEALKANLDIFSENVDVAPYIAQIDEALNLVENTTGNAQAEAVQNFNNTVESINEAMSGQTLEQSAREFNQDGYDTMRNATDGRRIAVTEDQYKSAGFKTLRDLNKAVFSGNPNSTIKFYAEGALNTIPLDNVYNEIRYLSKGELPAVLVGDQLPTLVNWISQYKSSKGDTVEVANWDRMKTDNRSQAETTVDNLADDTLDKLEDGSITAEDMSEVFNQLSELQRNNPRLAGRISELYQELSAAMMERVANASVYDEDIANATEDNIDELAEEIIEEVPREHNNTAGVKTGRWKKSDVFSNTGVKSGIVNEKIRALDKKYGHMMYENNTEAESMAEASSRIEKQGVDAVAKELMQKNNRGELWSNVETDEMMMVCHDAKAYAESLDAKGENSDEAWGYVYDILEAIKEQGSSKGQALQAYAKWSRSNTPEGLLAESTSIIEKAKKGENWNKEIAKQTKNAVNYDENGKPVRAMDINFVREFMTEAKKLEALKNDTRYNELVKEGMKPEKAQRRVNQEYKHVYDNLGKMINTQIPSGMVERVRTLLMDNMLGNARTLITRNAGGNIGFNLVEQFLRKPLSAVIDSAVSKARGSKRTVGDVNLLTKEGRQLYKEWGKGAKEALAQEIYDFKNGVHSARSGEVNLSTATGNNRTVFKNNKTNQAKGLNYLLNKADNLVRYGLSFGDRWAYEATYSQTLAELQQLYDAGKLETKYTTQDGKVITDKMSETEFKKWAEDQAKINALEACYQDDSEMAEAFLAARKLVNKISRATIGVDVLSQFTIPFAKTPANIIQRAIEYSPLGLAKNAIQTIREVNSDAGLNQRRFSVDTSRNIIGSALFALGILAAKSGVLTGGYDDDPDMAAAQREAGMQEYALNMGDKNVSIDWIPVLGNNAVAASAFYNALQNNPEMSMGQRLGQGLSEGLKTQFESSALQGLNRFISGSNSYSGNSGDLVSNAKDTLKSGLTQFIPSLLRQYAAATDPYSRQLSGANQDDYYYNAILNSIPGLRETLEPRIGRTGEYMEQNPGRTEFQKWMDNFLNPATVTVTTPDAVRDEAMRLYESTGNTDAFQTGVSIKDLKTDDHVPTAEEFTQYQQATYTAMNTIAENFIQSEYYQTLNDGDKETALNEIYSAIKSVEKLNTLGGDKSNLNGAAKAYDEGGEEGLINYVIARNTLATLGMSNNPTNREQIIETLSQGGTEAVQEMVDHSTELSNAGINSYNLQVKYDHAAGVIPSLTPEQFMTTWDDIDSNSNDSITQDEMIAYLNQNPTSYDLDTALQYWNAYGSDWSYQPYFDDETGTWKKKKP